MAKKDHLGSVVVYALASVLVAIVPLVASAAMASHTICAERRQIVENLKKNYGERTIYVGLASNGTVIETLASPSGSFTVILTRPDGYSCIMAAGEDFEPRPTIPDTPS